MSTSIWRGVRGELRRQLLAITGVPDIAYEMGEGVPGGTYKPVVGVPWLKEVMDKGPAVPATLGSGGSGGAASLAIS